MYSVWEIADWFKKWGEYKGEEVRQLRMMKFLFYAQAHHIQETGKPIFDDAEIVSWKFGPAVPEVNQAYKPVPNTDKKKYDIKTDFDWNNYSLEDSKFLVEIWNTYHHLDEGTLIEYSHRESVWIDTFVPNQKKAGIITIDKMKEAYYDGNKE